MLRGEQQVEGRRAIRISDERRVPKLGDPALAADEVITLVVQVNGRLRDRIEAPASVTEEEAKSAALRSERVKPFIEGKELTRVVYVPGKLVNVVAR